MIAKAKKSKGKTGGKGSGGESGLNVVTCGEFLDADIPTREAMLGTWLRERTLAMVYAKAGVGKSMLSVSVALAVAGGGELLGWEASKPRKVLVVDGEMDKADLQDRMRLLIQSVPGIDVELVRENLSLLAAQNQGPNVAFPDLAEDEGQQAVLDQVEDMGAELVILDNLSTLATMEDENAASSFDPIIRLMQALKLRGCATVLIHHAGKSGRYRGTSKIEAIFDAILQLSHPDGVPSHEGTAFNLNWEKYRGKMDGTTRPMSVRLETDENGEGAEWVAEASEDMRLIELVAMVRSLDYPSQKALADSLSTSPGNLSKLKRKAFTLNLIDEGEWGRCMDHAAKLATESAGVDCDF